MIIVDDITVQENLQEIVEYFFSTQTLFEYVEEASGLGVEYSPMAVKSFFDDGKILDNKLFAFLLPFLYSCVNNHKLKVVEIRRARVFYQPATVRETNYLHDLDLHRDVPSQQDIYNFLYYCNHSDGGTFVYNEDKTNKNLKKFVEHKKGRFIIFDDKLWHAGSKPTKNSRLVLAVNLKLEF